MNNQPGIRMFAGCATRFGRVAFALLLWIPSVSAVEWPYVAFRDGATNTVYQPQLEAWDYTTLKARSAVAVQMADSPQATLGTITFVANTRVDRAQREVFLEDVQITESDFPSAGGQAKIYEATLKSMVPKVISAISLDQLEASLAILDARQKSEGVPLRNDPPMIIFSTTPAMLILVDGPPAYRAVAKTSLERVLNTRALILRDKSGKHFLHLFDGYMEALALTGPWTVARNLPADIKTAERQAIAAKQVDMLVGQENPDTKKKPSLKSDPVPTLEISTVPAELIVLQGEPQWAPIPSTQLLYATNTASHVFKELTSQQNYLLLSGRWFRAPGFEGPWEFVPSANLPPDFAKIPDDSPKENSKAAVAGTHQAQEAAIANSIPQTVKVTRATARIDPAPQYEGAVQLRPIEGTTLQYVANSAVPVILVQPNSWYACQNGVWFQSTASTGPWIVATSVPAEIYSIPTSSPMHYVVYARIARYDPTYVWVATTPGYYGTVVTTDGVVVYGTGYYYPAYVGVTTYVAYPVTYGYACNPCWTPWAGWAFGFGVGWALWSDWYWWYGCPPAPYWGPYWGACYGSYYNAYGGITAWGPYGWAGTSGYIYHQRGSWTGVSRAAGGYNAWTGNQWATQYGRAYNSTTGTRAVGHRGAVHNVYSGNYAYGGRGAFYNENSGVAGAGGKVSWGNDSTGNQGSAGRGTIYNPNTGNTTTISGVKGEQGGVVNVNGNVIAGHDGNYYRPDGAGGWEQVTRPGTPTPHPGAGGSGTRDVPGAAQRPAQAGNLGAAQRPSPPAQTQWQPSTPSPQQRQSLDREYNARQSAAQRQQSFQTHRPTSFQGGGGGYRGGGGGARRGGGGGRR